MIKPRFGESRPYWDITGNKQAEDYTRLMRARAVYAKNLTDGRQIRIDAEHGIQALDSEDTVIHDTPDCVIASDMTYGGHIIFKDAPSVIDSVGVIANDTSTEYIASSNITNTDLSTIMPTGLTNVKGIIAIIDLYINIYNTKTKLGTQVVGEVRYSSVYNTDPSTNNYLARVDMRHTATDADNLTFFFRQNYQVLIPIVWNSNVPYITWRMFAGFSDMTSVSAPYEINASLIVQGFLV